MKFQIQVSVIVDVIYDQIDDVCNIWHEFLVTQSKVWR